MLKRLLAAAALGCAALSAQAQGSLPENIAAFEVLPGWRTAEGSHMAALRISLAPGWKTYWRAPGDAGIPPSFDWTGSRNLRAVRFHWPVPEVFDQNGMRTVGYVRELVLPMELTPERAGGAIRLQAAIDLGVCQDVCVPMSARIAAELPPAGGPDRSIDRALANRPATAREAGVGGVACRIEPIEDGLRVTATIEMPALGPDEMAVFELADRSVWVAEASETRRGERLTAVTEMVPPSNAPFFLDRSDVTITVLGAGRGVEIAGCKG